jgi:hypothetical protein
LKNDALKNPPGLAFLLTLFLLNPALLPRLLSQELKGEDVLRAYQYSYPEKVQEVAWKNGDWTIQIGDQIFYWAEGRLLPPELRNNWRDYRAHSFVPYPAEIPAPEQYTSSQIEALRREAGVEARNVEDYHRAFQGALYGGTAQGEIDGSLKRIAFLGKAFSVHSLIEEPLKRVEAAINRASGQDRQVASFVASIESIGGYNWREIQGTQRMSYHSWGLAVDILSNEAAAGGSEPNKPVYWRWELARNENWMLIPLSRRWIPPVPVIRAFENEGFIWGGKWPLYDNMHFEFRPEVHEMNRIIAGGGGNTRIIQSESTRDLNHIFPIK